MPFYLVCALSYSCVKEKERGTHTTLARNHLPSDVRLCLCISSPSSFSLSLISSNGIIAFIDPFVFFQIRFFVGPSFMWIIQCMMPSIPSCHTRHTWERAECLGHIRSIADNQSFRNRLWDHAKQ